MSDATKIQWCDSTVNPVMGCSGCELWNGERKTCYAGQLHRLRSKNKGFSPDFITPKLFPGRMVKAARWSDLTDVERTEKPWLKKMPRLIFVSDMGDALSEGEVLDPNNHRLSGGVPFDFLKTEIIDTVLSTNGHKHVWLWLTKRPKRLAQFSEWLRRKHRIDWPANLWVGTTVTTKKTLARIDQLRNVGGPSTVRFISAEPLWESVSLAGHLNGIAWLIVGGESQQGSEAREFRLEWARQLRDECKAEGVSFFLKQLGSQPTLNGMPFDAGGGHGDDWLRWPKDLRVRQMPSLRVGSDGKSHQHSSPHSLSVNTKRDRKQEPLTAPESREATVKQLLDIATELFERKSVWETTCLDHEVLKRWEEKTGETVANYDTLVTGRNRLANLVDWVKATFTRSGHTFNLMVGRTEYRVWRSQPLQRVVTELAAELTASR